MKFRLIDMHLILSLKDVHISKAVPQKKLYEFLCYREDNHFSMKKYKQKENHNEHFLYCNHFMDNKSWKLNFEHILYLKIYG